jgi:hypothetical protein
LQLGAFSKSIQAGDKACIDKHNAVVAGLPKGKYGLTSTATVAKDVLRHPKHDIRFSNMVVSAPVGRTGDVIHYEFGKTAEERRFQRTGSLDSPPPVLLTALNKRLGFHNPDVPISNFRSTAMHLQLYLRVEWVLAC